MNVSYKLILTYWACLAKQNFTCVMKYFSVATTFVFCYDAKHSTILQISRHVCYYLFSSTFPYQQTRYLTKMPFKFRKMFF